MINPTHLRTYIIRPVLKEFRVWSPDAEELLMGTCAQESNLGFYLHQLGGPGLGIFQMEPRTYLDLRNNYFPRLKKRLKKFENLIIPGNPEVMIYDLRLATIMARIFYLRIPRDIPNQNSPEEMAQYWKKYYNTSAGKGTVEEYKKNYRRYAINIY